MSSYNFLATLFRGTEISNKVFKFFGRMVALPYLFATLGRLLFDLYTEIAEEEQLMVKIHQYYFNPLCSSKKD